MLFLYVFFYPTINIIEPIKKLENIVDEELKEIAEVIKINREGVYQENFLKEIMEEVGCYDK